MPLRLRPADVRRHFRTRASLENTGRSRSGRRHRSGNLLACAVLARPETAWRAGRAVALVHRRAGPARAGRPAAVWPIPSPRSWC